MSIHETWIVLIDLLPCVVLIDMCDPYLLSMKRKTMVILLDSDLLRSSRLNELFWKIFCIYNFRLSSATSRRRLTRRPAEAWAVWVAWAAWEVWEVWAAWCKQCPGPTCWSTNHRYLPEPTWTISLTPLTHLSRSKTLAATVSNLCLKNLYLILHLYLVSALQRVLRASSSTHHHPMFLYGSVAAIYSSPCGQTPLLLMKKSKLSSILCRILCVEKFHVNLFFCREEINFWLFFSEAWLVCWAAW